MKRIENFDGSVTYRIEYRGIGVQETISEPMLKALKSMPRLNYQKENWYEDSILMTLIIKWNELSQNTNNQ